MTEKTLLGESICSSQDKIKLDEHIKNVLAFKPVLARIFNEVVTECKDMSYDEIEQCIEGDISIDLIGLNPGTTNLPKIEGNAQEDAVPNEGKVTFDVRTILRIPQLDTNIGVKLLIDVEAQKDDSPGYDISERAIFYCCRMISSQLGTEFTNSTNDNAKYRNLKKVYSIWICTESAQKRANTIERYRINRDVLPKEKNSEIPRYDLLEAIIINISKYHNVEDTNSTLIKLLTDLFNEEMDAKEKINKLKSEYGLPTTIDFEKEVSDMTAYAARLNESGYVKGIADGENKLGELITKLISLGRVNDVQKAASDEEARKAFYKEFGMIDE